MSRFASSIAGVALVAAVLPSSAFAQVATAAPAATAPDVVVTPSLAPKTPLLSEAATAAVTRFSFIAYGDTRGRHDGVSIQSEHELVIESMIGTIRRAAPTPDAIKFVLSSGDAVVDGSRGAQLNVSYIPLINRLTQEGGVPLFLSVGNHDVGISTNLTDPRRVAGLKNYFAANANLIPAEGSVRRLKGYPTYAFGYGNSFFIAVDSDIPDDSVQFAWMKSQLEGLDRKRFVNIVVFYHHPAYSSGPHGGATIEPQAASIRTKWMPLFRQHHVKMLLTGHEHLFEHYVERYSDASGSYRMDQIVTGGGGAPLYGYSGEPDLRAYIRAAAAEKLSVQHLAKPGLEPGGSPFHYIVVHVDGDKVSLDVVAADFARGYAPYRSSSAALTDGRP